MAKVNIDQIQIVALAAVEDPDWSAQYREICRWYSREFSTPLHFVENDLDMVQVLKHYYEDAFRKLAASTNEQQQVRYEEIKHRLVYGADEEEAEKTEEEDDEWAQKMLEEIKADEEKHRKAEAKKKKKQQVKPIVVNDAESLNNPNLEEEIEFSVQGEDSPPDY